MSPKKLRGVGNLQKRENESHGEVGYNFLSLEGELDVGR